MCVDLDGTLLKSDLLYESASALLRKNPLYFFLFPVWLLKGKANLKHQIAKRVQLNPACLPYCETVLDYLKDQQSRGRKLVLATASNVKLVQPIADHLEIFSEVLASDTEVNLAGHRKAALLVDRFGREGFDYAGNSRVDLAIWSQCSEPVVVSSSQRLHAAVQNLKSNATFLERRAPKLTHFFRAIRVHQWVKNLLLFIPLITAHQWLDMQRVLETVWGFFSFCLCSSSVYLLNDLLDLESDRQHHQKRKRPFASGDLSLLGGAVLIPLMLALSLLMALRTNLYFVGGLLGYWIVTMTYSFVLKRLVLLDVITLALLYTLRILAGGFAANVRVSEWLLAFSMFIFFSLACIKRYSELLNLRRANKVTAQGRGYVADDLELIAQFGAASGYISILVMALYVSSAEITRLYSHPAVLWMICPVLLYWLSRIWLLAHRGELDEDPIVFALSDKASYISGLVSLAFVLLAL
ncbi:MAG: UbiA family prenyltransferase [Bdellovibrionales bacterium]|nr:UbiA family prenyltransferase [Bdellovibrionales bacterium]